MKRAKNRKLVKVTYALNGKGFRIGESHQNAKLADCEVELIIRLYESGEWTAIELASKFDINRRTVHSYLSGERRAQSVAGYKVLHVLPSKL